MATAISATVVGATVDYPAHVEISVTGAPTPPTNAYTSDFSAGADSWTVTSGGGGAGTSYFPGLLTVKGAPATTTPTYVHRAITGLTVGAEYRYRAVTPSGYPRLGKFLIRVRQTTGGSDVATTAWLQPYSSSQAYTAELLFTATATTMYIQIGAYYEPAGYAAQYTFSTITVQPSGSWTPPRLVRSDVNEGSVLLDVDDLYRNGAAEPTTSSYTIYDWESARTGEVQYQLVDGLSALSNVATVDVTSGFAATDPIVLNPETGRMLYSGSWATTTPDWVDIKLVTGYAARREFNGSVHTIIGRSDKIANPGPLMMRSGSVDLFCETYADALALTDLVASGNVLWFAQPDFPGLDMYFIGQSISLRPEEASSDETRWIATLEFEEVSAP